MISFLQRFIKKAIDTSEDAIHDLKVIQLNVFSESDSQIDFYFINKVLNTLHYKVSSLGELCETLNSGTQLYFITF